MPPLSSSVSNTILSKLKDLKLIIMDEVSMIGSKVLAQINTRLQQIFRSDKIFAGKSIIMLGDFNQLAPVGDRYIFKPDPSNPYSELIGSPLWEKFSFYSLTEIMRQKDDAKFAMALNNLAEGKLTNEEIEMFNSRVTLTEPPGTLRLYRSNAEVDAFNEHVLQGRADTITVSADDKVIGNVTENVRTSLLKTVEGLKTTCTYGLPKTIKLSVGIHYMLTNNIDVTDGLVNGAVGTLQYIEKNSFGDVKRIWLRFDDQNVGKKSRNASRKNCAVQKIDKTLCLTPLEMLSRNIKPRKNSLAIVMRKQFPVVPAEAITIYKSQGGTYSSIIVTLKAGMKRNEIYVALSRVTSLSGLFIHGKFTPPWQSNDEVSKVIKSSMKMKPVLMKLMFLENCKDFSIVFHNVQSLNRHHADLKTNPFMTAATIIAVVETWTLCSDDVGIDGYQEVYRVDVKNTKRHAYGVIVYCKTEHAGSVELLFDYNCEQITKACNLVGLKVNNTSICIGYKPPSTELTEVKQELIKMLDVVGIEQNDVIVVGDFNIDLMNKTSKSFENLLISKKLENKIVNQVSTNGLTQIDVCFSNISTLTANYFESYYSYHKPIVCVDRLNKEDNIPNVLISPDSSKDNKIIENVGKTTKTIPDDCHTAGSQLYSNNEQHNTTNNDGRQRLHSLPVGFSNTDNVSCYANVVCQSMFYVTPLAQAVSSEPTQNEITSLFHSYITASNTLSTWSVRSFVDEKNNIQQFTLNEQQDAAEFITYFSNCLSQLKNVFLHNLKYEYKCTRCSYNVQNECDNSILQLSTRKRIRSLKRLYEMNYNEWMEMEGLCRNCDTSNSMVAKTTVSLGERCSVIFVQLIIFKQDRGVQVKNPQSLCNLENSILRVDNCNFKVSGLISHHGHNINHGHYTCKLKTKDESWIMINDNVVRKCIAPNIEKDAYILILEKC